MKNEVENPALQIGQYKLLTTLGNGAFGKVKLAEHVITKNQVAIKIINKGRIRSLDMMDKVRREILILSKCRHPHIIRLYQVIDTPSDIFVVMEYVRGGELFDNIVSKGRIPPDEARTIFQQFISGVEYCHFHRIVHRDLKPENLLLDSNGSIKIADFGLSNWMRDGDFLRTSCGSPNYAAPEVISGALYAGPEVDVWSAGVILYALLCGSLPFDDDSIPSLFKKIKSGMYSLPSHLSQLARDLIPRMLVVDPMKRITIPEIIAHPWYRHNLAPYLMLPPGKIEMEERQLDMSIVSQVCRLKNCTPEQVAAAVRRRRRHTNDIKVVFELLLDQKRAQQRKEEIVGARNNRTPSLSGYHPTQSADNMNNQRSNSEAGENLPERSNSSAGPDNSVNKNLSSKIPVSNALAAASKRRRWYLGIQSKKEAAHVMTEVYKALFHLGCDWRCVSSYKAIGRWWPNRPNPNNHDNINTNMNCINKNITKDMNASMNNSTGDGGSRRGSVNVVPMQVTSTLPTVDKEVIPPRDGVRWGATLQSIAISKAQHPLDQRDIDYMVKIGLTLYKVQSKIYLLDFQALEGDPFSFMMLCAKIITHLKTLGGQKASVPAVPSQSATPSLSSLRGSLSTPSLGIMEAAQQATAATGHQPKQRKLDQQIPPYNNANNANNINQSAMATSPTKLQNLQNRPTPPVPILHGTVSHTVDGSSISNSTGFALPASANEHAFKLRQIEGYDGLRDIQMTMDVDS